MKNTNIISRGLAALLLALSSLAQQATNNLPRSSVRDNPGVPGMGYSDFH